MALSIPGLKAAEGVLEPAQIRTARRGRKLRSVGWFGVLASVAIVAVAEAGSVTSAKGLAVAGIVLTVSLALINWTRIWVRESREPFQFTFSIEQFEPDPDPAATIGSGNDETLLPWLRRDLIEKLSARTGRLSLLEDSRLPAEEPDQEPWSHLHVSGWCGLRPYGDGSWCLEVTPRVRLGGPNAPETMARTIRFALGDLQPVAKQRRLPFWRRLADGKEQEPKPTRLPKDEYDRLCERVYWSVAAEIYAQIRRGVEDKVALLPPGRLRAAAYLYEADDYVASNTLDAYEAARDLYRKALEMYDVESRVPSATAWRRTFRRLHRLAQRLGGRLRRLLSKGLRRLARREVLLARAQLGYGRMLVASWRLKLLSGCLPHELFEAPPNIEAAIARLEKVPHDVPERDAVLFRARVTLAICSSHLKDLTGAREALRAAEEMRPAGARTDAEFLLASALVESNHLDALRLISAAVDRDPTLILARFRRAHLLEELWRRRPTPEPDVASEIDQEYAAVIAIDPGNVSAWANRGYVCWLLAPADPDLEGPTVEGQPRWRRRAASALKAGREYKDVSTETMVGELDWNLARMAAEEGNFAAAYSHYIAAVSAMIASPRLGFVEYFYRDANESLVRRYDAYREQTEQQAEAALAVDGSRGRQVKSVLAFALNDCGMAHYAFFKRRGEAQALAEARGLFAAAIDLNHSFVLPKFNLGRLCIELAKDTRLKIDARRNHLAEALGLAREVLEIEPEWVLGRFLIVDAELRAIELERTLLPAEQRPLADLAPERRLQGLLPQAVLGDGSLRGGKVDRHGSFVAELMRDRRLQRTNDFDEVQLLALDQWTRILALDDPAAAVELCRRLQGDFHRFDPALVAIHERAAARLLAQAGPGDQEELRVEYWDRQTASLVAIADLLARDPSNHDGLVRFASLLPAAAQRRILAAATREEPSPVTARWIRLQLARAGTAALEFPRLPTAPDLTPLATAALRVGDPERILQIECGDGDGALYLAREFQRASVRGVDSSERAIRAATGRIGLDPEGRVAFKVGGPKGLPYPDRNFDLVALLDRKPPIGEVARVLRPHGYLILAYSGHDKAPRGLAAWYLRNRLASAGIDLVGAGDAQDGSFAIGRRRR